MKWYAIRVTYSRELKLKEILDAKSIESFLPMCYKLFEKGERKERKLVPAIHNLVFIRSNKRMLDTLKNELENKIPIRYIINKATKSPIIIPDSDMQNFIAVAGTQDEQLMYLEKVDLLCGKGDKVRITGGLFSGVEGEVIRIKRDRRIIVAIRGLIAVATAHIHPSLIEKI